MSDRPRGCLGARRLAIVPCLCWLASCAPAEDKRLLGRWESVTPEGFRYLEFGPEGEVALGDDFHRMSRGRYRFHGKRKIIVEIPARSSFPGEFEVWQVTPSAESLATYREGSFGLAAASRKFRRVAGYSGRSGKVPQGGSNVPR